MSERVLGVLLLLGLSIQLGACGEGRAADGTLQIAVVPKGTTHEFWKTVHAGAEFAAADLGVEVLWKGPLREDDRDEQIKVLEGQIARGVDGIVLAPLDEVALVSVAKEAAAEGIPLVVFDSDLAWDGRVSYVATDNYSGGVLAARELGRLLGGEGTAMMLRCRLSALLRRAGHGHGLGLGHPGEPTVSTRRR